MTPYIVYLVLTPCTILLHKACFEMIMLYRQFIADYENEAVDVLTYCVRQAARNYDEV